MSLDHGILNLPLSKRGDIDKQIDAHKAAKSKAESNARRERAKTMTADRITAKALVAGLSDDRLRKFLLTDSTWCRRVSVFRKQLRSEAHWNPKAVIAAFGEPA